MSSTHESVPAEGPLAHDARVTAERSYLDGLADARRTAFERASGARPERTSKRLLVALSHSIERAVMSGPIEKPTVVVALFQELRFFDREREVYERLAEAGVHVLVAYVEDAGHQAPHGVDVVHLRRDEPLSDEWSVVAVGPRAGAFLVATDRHSFDPTEREHEASREFVGRWGYSHAQASTELARLRFTLGDRIDPDLRAVVDDLLATHMPAGGSPAASAGTPGETWATSSLNHMLDGMMSAGAGTRELREQLADAQRAVSARAASTTDPQSGVSNPDFLQRWSRPAAGNPLPVGLALFDVAELDSDGIRADERAAYFAAHQVAAALGQPLGPVDAVVRLSAREFLVVVPGASTRHLATLCDRVGEQLELASRGYPDVSLRARIATVVTSARPLPVRELQSALDGPEPGWPGPVDGGRIGDGNRIVVSSTALHAPDTAPTGAAASGGAGSAPAGRDEVAGSDVAGSDVPGSGVAGSDVAAPGGAGDGGATVAGTGSDGARAPGAPGSGSGDSGPGDAGPGDPGPGDAGPDGAGSDGPTTRSGGFVATVRATTAASPGSAPDPGPVAPRPSTTVATGDGSRTASPRPSPSTRPTATLSPTGTPSPDGTGEDTGSEPDTGPNPLVGPPLPRPEVSPLGHTGNPDDAAPAGEATGLRAVPSGDDAPAAPHSPQHGSGTDDPVEPRPGRAGGAHRSRSAEDRPGPETDAGPSGFLPQRTAQEALRRLVYGEDEASTGDPRARSDVFADLSDPPNGRTRPSL